MPLIKLQFSGQKTVAVIPRPWLFERIIIVVLRRPLLFGRKIVVLNAPHAYVPAYTSARLLTRELIEDLPHPCPEINGNKCIEIFLPLIKTALCSGCRHNTRRVPEKLLEKHMLAQERKDATSKFKQAVYAQLHNDLDERPPYLRGITDALDICHFTGVDREDFIVFHKLAVKASKHGKQAKLFDFIDEDGRTFVAIHVHNARFQTYLDEEDLLEQRRELSLKNPRVSKIYEGMVELQKILTRELYRIPGVRERIPPHLSPTSAKWGP